jgi:hypothetical protein
MAGARRAHRYCVREALHGEVHKWAYILSVVSEPHPKGSDLAGLSFAQP